MNTILITGASSGVCLQTPRTFLDRRWALNVVSQQLNERPRKTLGYETHQSDANKLLRRSVEFKLLS
ncbi:MAG: hypothetical protein V4673_05640 [Pseudomonadota bacterium]